MRRICSSVGYDKDALYPNAVEIL